MIDEPDVVEGEVVSRDEQIRRDAAAGATPEELGQHWGITAERVRQIIRAGRELAEPAAVVVKPFGWTPPPRIAALAQRADPDEQLSAEAARLVFQGIPKNTRDTYALQWRRFVRWCGETGRCELPATPATVIEYMNELWRTPGRYGRPTAPSTVRLALAVIAVAHKRARRPELDEGGRPQYGYVPPSAHPTVHQAMRGYTRQWLEAGHRPDTAYPLSKAEHATMIATFDIRTPMGLCNAALLCVGYDGGFRRSELCAINIDDVEVHVAGDEVGSDPETVDELVIHVPMSKTDQTGEGDEVVLQAHDAEWASTCPVRLTKLWLERLAEAGFTSGPLFRVVLTGGKKPADGRPQSGKIVDKRLGGDRIEQLVRATAEAAGLSVPIPGKRKRKRHIVPHSLRAGSATASAEAGADVPELAEHYRWKPGSPTPMRYVRFGRKRSKNPVAKIWRRRRRTPGAGEQDQ